ncbi:MAG: penicillin-binding transpeptidase domain-containing protein [Myxococcota bacterium]
MRALRFGVLWLVLGAAIAAATGDAGADATQSLGPRKAEVAAPAAEPALPEARDPLAPPAILEGFDPEARELEGEVFVAGLSAPDKRAVLSLDPGLQQHVANVFRRYEVPFGAFVAVEPATGRVRAYVSHSSANPGAGDLVLDATPPTASVFKVVTASALVDTGVGSNARVCFRGGASRIMARHLENDATSSRCATLSDAMGGSINAVFAQLSDEHLDGPTLTRYASAFGFGHRLPFDVRTVPSPAEVPDDRLERARTAAGFWHMHMSPLHGAMIAATIANDGVMMRPAIVERVDNVSGEVFYEFEPTEFRRVIPRRTARIVGTMMQRTVADGTARRAFRDPRGRPFIPDVAIAGKTGTLSAERPYRGYTWFVGYAPADAPTIAVAALVVNTPRWRIKAPFVAREGLRYALSHRESAD